MSERVIWIALVASMAILGIRFGSRLLLRRHARARHAERALRDTEAVAVTERVRFDEELERHRQLLEELVAERTHELRAANASLKFAAEFNRDIADAIPGPVAYWDPDLRCRFANAAFASFLHKTPEEMLGRSASELFPRETFAGIHDVVAATLSGQMQHFEAQTQLPDGSTQVLKVHCIPEMRADRTVRGVYLMSFDITELKQVESELKRANQDLALSRDRAQSATRAKSAFLANMSHEIRTPMNAIIGLTHLMTRESRDSRQLERLGNVNDAAQHLLHVITDILDLSKIEAGKLTLMNTEFSLDSVLSQASEMVAERAHAKGLALFIDADQMPKRLCGDPTRLAQILINLLSNAVKFTAHGWVRLRGVVLDEDDTGLGVRFEVQDTGPGIAPAQQIELFNAFEQADSSKSRHHGGTGLGLALSRQLAIAMGGNAGVVSAPGAGSTFWFTARLRRAADAAQRLHPASAEGEVLHEPIDGLSLQDDPIGRLDRAGTSPPTVNPHPSEIEALLRARHVGKRILLAEDNAVNRLVAEELMRAVGLVVESAWDGARAIEMALSRPYALILMDLQMPGVDGLDAARAIRDKLGAVPPIIAMTADAFMEDREACLAAGMNDHTSKPVEPPRMYATLLRWLPGHASVNDPAAAEAAPAANTFNMILGSPLRDRLARIEGFDLDAALRVVGGQMAVLERILRRFVVTYRQGLPILLDATGDEHETILNWRVVCHSVRGALSSIGATRILQAVTALETELRRLASRATLVPQGKQVHQDVIDLVKALERELDAVAEAVSEPERT